MVSKVLKKCKKIKVVLTDVDGVLTDGGMYYSAQGDTLKKFHTRDGMGVTMLRKIGIPTIIVTKEKNNIIKQWGKKMKVKKIFDGIIRKDMVLKDVYKNFGIMSEQIAYLGDDVNDLELLKKVGLSAVPNDGIQKAKKICDYVCKKRGGEGAFRELTDLILSTKKLNPKI